MSERQERLAEQRVEKLRRSIDSVKNELTAATDPAQRADLEKKLEDLNEEFDRAVDSPSY